MFSSCSPWVLATGLVVDDGIVVTENIYKRMERGMNKWQAAVEGSKEIYFAVIATSITLAVVFLPIIFLKGFVGRLFREFGIVVAVPFYFRVCIAHSRPY